MSKQASAPVKINVRPRKPPASDLLLPPGESSRKQKEYTIVVTGCTGRGKSTFCNFLSKSNRFRSDIQGSEMGSGEFGGWGAVAADLTGTQFHTVEDLVRGITVHIIDLPGYLATQNQTGNDREDLAMDGEMVLDEFAKAMMYAKDGVDAILVTLEAGRRFTREEQLLMEFISLLQFWDHCILLFTHGDKVGKNEDERYGNMHKLIASPDFSSRCPVLHKMLQYVSKRFIIVESVNRKDDPHYYHSKMDELCKAIEVVHGKTRASISHPLLRLARNAFEVSQEKLDLKEVLDQEQESRCYIEVQLEQAQKQRDEWVGAYKDLQVQLEAEKAEKERLDDKLQEEAQEKAITQNKLEHAQSEWKKREKVCTSLQEQLENEKTETERLRYNEHRRTEVQETTQMQFQQAQSEWKKKERHLQVQLEREKAAKATINQELQVEQNKQTEFIEQRQNLLDALRQRQCRDGDQDAGVDVLIRWLREPQTNPGEVADMLSSLCELANKRKHAGKAQTRRGDRTRVCASLTSSAVREDVNVDIASAREPACARKDDGEKKPEKKSRCSLL